MSDAGVVPSYRRSDGDWMRVRWKIAGGGPVFSAIERDLQQLSDEGWTVFQVLPQGAIVAYRYEVAGVPEGE